MQSVIIGLSLYSLFSLYLSCLESILLKGLTLCYLVHLVQQDVLGSTVTDLKESITEMGTYRDAGVVDFYFDISYYDMVLFNLCCMSRLINKLMLHQPRYL